MDSYSRREKVTKTVSYGLPTGTPYPEFIKLYNVARRELESTKKDPKTVYDDEIRVVSGDEEVFLVFNTEVTDET